MERKICTLHDFVESGLIKECRNCGVFYNIESYRGEIIMTCRVHHNYQPWCSDCEIVQEKRYKHRNEVSKGGTTMPSGQKQLTGGIKHDESKRRLDLVPSSLTNAVARILEFGAKKYGDNNWKKGLVWSRVYAALQRHLTDFWDGNDLDSESALPHLYHAACNVAFLIEFYEKRKDLDDRYKIPEPQESLADKAERAKRLMNE